MQRYVLLLTLAAVILLVVAACATNSIEDQSIMAQTPSIRVQLLRDESTPLPICHDRALYLFEAINAIIDSDGGSLWSVDLHGPIMFVDAGSRYAVSNMPDANNEIFTRHGDLYIGIIPECTAISSSNVMLNDMHWAMISWGDIRDDDHKWSMSLMLHKLFHTRQPYIFQGNRNWGSTEYMEALDASISGRLEINALLHALRTTGEERLISIYNALSIRHERYENYSEFSASGVVVQEILEGTVTYTEVILLFDDMEDRLQFIERAMYTTERITLFGYWSGALYGLLLDELGVNWRDGLAWYADLADMLQNSIDFGGAIPLSEIDLERYGYSAIRTAEEARIAEIERMTQEVKSLFSGVLLLLNASGAELIAELEDTDMIRIAGGLEFPNYSEFDYGYKQEVVDYFTGEPALREIHLMHGMDTIVYYGNFSFVWPWGELVVNGGFLAHWHLMLRHTIPADNMEINGNVITGTNWVLTLNDGFELREVDGGHFAISRR